MRFRSTAFLLLVSITATLAQPLRLLPKNPHYFEYDGRQTLLIGSGEHYGAVVNQDFDYRTYLATLAADGLNNTRLFTGAYVEKPGDFNIQKIPWPPAKTGSCYPGHGANSPVTPSAATASTWTAGTKHTLSDCAVSWRGRRNSALW